MIDLSFLVVGIIFFFRILSWLIIIRVLLSWIIPTANNPLVMFIYDTSDTVLRPIRRIVRTRGGIDWAPLIAIVLLDVLQYGVTRLFS